jgi:hypothetical protein
MISDKWLIVNGFFRQPSTVNRQQKLTIYHSPLTIKKSAQMARMLQMDMDLFL